MEPSLLQKTLAEADVTAPLEDLQIYLNWIVTKSHRHAISTFFRGMPGLNDSCDMNTWLGGCIGRPVGEVIRELLASTETLRVAAGMSCLSSALPVPPGCFEGNAIDCFEKLARTRRTCFIGHFQEGAAWREQGYPVNIIELFPQPGDIHWDQSHEVLAAAEIVLMTGLTLVNDTFREVIRRTPNASIRVIMGPTVPFSALFFSEGIHFVGSTLVDDVEKLAGYCRRGGGSIAHAPAGALRKVNLTCLPELRDGH
ncbi:MAG: Rossmann-like domain-containing protein [Thermoguttaceae bacterium]